MQGQFVLMVLYKSMVNTKSTKLSICLWSKVSKRYKRNIIIENLH